MYMRLKALVRPPFGDMALVDRYNTEVDETLFDSVISATSFLDDDYMAAILRKADAAQRG